MAPPIRTGARSSRCSVIVDFVKLAGDSPPVDAGIRPCRFDIGNEPSATVVGNRLTGHEISVETYSEVGGAEDPGGLQHEVVSQCIADWISLPPGEINRASDW